MFGVASCNAHNEAAVYAIRTFADTKTKKKTAPRDNVRCDMQLPCCMLATCTGGRISPACLGSAGAMESAGTIELSIPRSVSHGGSFQRRTVGHHSRHPLRQVGIKIVHNRYKSVNRLV